MLAGKLLDSFGMVNLCENVCVFVWWLNVEGSLLLLIIAETVAATKNTSNANNNLVLIGHRLSTIDHGLAW